MYRLSKSGFGVYNFYMRNPFRKMSPEEEFVVAFLEGAKNANFKSSDATSSFALIKAKFREGDYVAAQQEVNKLVKMSTSPLREATEQRTQELINNLKNSQSNNE